jgi:hypothetical protein
MRYRTEAVLIGAVACALYPALLRRRVLTWGATPEESGAALPGDELLPDADGVSTRVIAVDAPADAVWPWLAQMGPAPRGGAYTYDWIENLLGLNMDSADRILPDYQHPQVGDTIGFGANRMRLERVDPGPPDRVLAWRSEDGSWVWTFVIRDESGGTRLISRNRFRFPSQLVRVMWPAMEVGSLVMERKMLRGIRRRAERLAAGRGPAADTLPPAPDAPMTSGRPGGAIAPGAPGPPPAGRPAG